MHPQLASLSRLFISGKGAISLLWVPTLNMSFCMASLKVNQGNDYCLPITPISMNPILMTLDSATRRLQVSYLHLEDRVFSMTAFSSTPADRLVLLFLVFLMPL